MSGLADRLSRLVVGLYPRRWRRRYREELLALLEDHPSSPRTVANLALGALGTHLDPGYRREGIAMSRLGSALRTTAQVAAFTVPLILVIGVLLALDVRHEQQTDGGTDRQLRGRCSRLPEHAAGRHRTGNRSRGQLL